MDGVALQAERWARRHSQAWCCSSCLIAPLEDRAELELMELSLSLPSLMLLLWAGCFLAVLRPAQLSCQLHFARGEWKPHLERGLRIMVWLFLAQIAPEWKSGIIHRDHPDGFFVYTGKEAYLFSALIATLKSLTDKGFQRLRILHLWVWSCSQGRCVLWM